MILPLITTEMCDIELTLLNERQPLDYISPSMVRLFWSGSQPHTADELTEKEEEHPTLGTTCHFPVWLSGDVEEEF